MCYSEHGSDHSAHVFPDSEFPHIFYPQQCLERHLISLNEPLWVLNPADPLFLSFCYSDGDGGGDCEGDGDCAGDGDCEGGGT